MGLNKNTEKSTYLSVSGGKLIKTHKQPNADTVERVNKLGRTVYEEHFVDLTGKLVDIATREHQDYGKQWQLKFESDGEIFLIQMPFSGRYASSFLRVLPNLDLKKEMRFKPWEMTDKNDASKKVSGITIYQGGKILPYYTKDEPNGLPELKQVKVKGKITWDDSDLMDFLENMVKNEIVPKLKEPVAAIYEQDDEDDDEIDEKLPF